MVRRIYRILWKLPDQQQWHHDGRPGDYQLFKSRICFLIIYVPLMATRVLIESCFAFIRFYLQNLVRTTLLHTCIPPHRLHQHCNTLEVSSFIFILDTPPPFLEFSPPTLHPSKIFGFRLYT
jgi:hypothetical protein